MTGLSIHMLAEAIASGLGDEFDHAHVDKPEWVATRGEKGGRFRDVNEPRQSDYLDTARAVLAAIDAAGWAVVPREASDGLLVSMAIRQDHGLGVSGYYDGLVFPRDGGGGHAKRLASAVRSMRKLHEEVVGAGFYKPEKEASYAAMLQSAPKISEG